MSDKPEQTEQNKKSTLVKATLIGFVVGVGFMLTAVFVNFAMR